MAKIIKKQLSSLLDIFRTIPLIHRTIVHDDRHWAYLELFRIRMFPYIWMINYDLKHNLSIHTMAYIIIWFNIDMHNRFQKFLFFKSSKRLRMSAVG